MLSLVGRGFQGKKKLLPQRWVVQMLCWLKETQLFHSFYNFLNSDVNTVLIKYFGTKQNINKGNVIFKITFVH